MTYGLGLDNVYDRTCLEERSASRGGQQGLSFLFLIGTSLLFRHAWDGQNEKVPPPEMVLGTLPLPRLGSTRRSNYTREFISSLFLGGFTDDSRFLPLRNYSEACITVCLF